MNINWKVRIKNKTFWLALIPATLLLIQSIAVIFGVELQINTLNDQLINMIEALFVVLAILGIVIDPTTDGVGDSEQAMQYLSPKKDSVG